MKRKEVLSSIKIAKGVINSGDFFCRVFAFFIKMLENLTSVTDGTSRVVTFKYHQRTMKSLNVRNLLLKDDTNSGFSTLALFLFPDGNEKFLSPQYINLHKKIN